MNTENEYGLHSKFDIEKHKQTFINYLEVIIHEDGTVCYATPSHQEYLINYGCNLLNCDRETFYDLCPREYYGNYMIWLCGITKCVSVWSEGYICFNLNEITDKQREVLQSFIDNGLMKNVALR